MSTQVNIPVNLASGTVKLIAYQAGQPLNGVTPEAWNDGHYTSYVIAASLAGGNAVGLVPDNADTVDVRLYTGTVGTDKTSILNQGNVSDFSVDPRTTQATSAATDGIANQLNTIDGKVGTVNTKLGVPAVSVSADIAAIPAAVFAVSIDGKPFSKIMDALKAFFNGKCIVTNLGGDSRRVDFYAADNSTIVFTATFTASSGVRSSGGTFP
jgi:hypothetical protein